MATSHVFGLKFWTQSEERPWIDFELPENQPTISWLDIGRILNGEAVASQYSLVRLVVNEKDANEWHTYEVAGTYGLLSKTAVNLIGHNMTQWFEFLDAQINGLPFYFLRKKNCLSCLDRQNSLIVPFPGQPSSVMRIDRYRFFKDQVPDPAIFCIPEIRWHLFATDSIRRIIHSSNLKGFYLTDVEV
jgi:hypothetical protein